MKLTDSQVRHYVLDNLKKITSVKNSIQARSQSRINLTLLKPLNSSSASAITKVLKCCFFKMLLVMYYSIFIIAYLIFMSSGSKR